MRSERCAPSPSFTESMKHCLDDLDRERGSADDAGSVLPLVVVRLLLLMFVYGTVRT